jgi:hypothetical protein
MSHNTESRITELESQVAVAQAEITTTQRELAAAQAELAALKGAGKPARVVSPPPADEGVRISVLVPGVNNHLPSLDECRALHKIIVARHPRLDTFASERWRKDDDHFALEGFRAAFAYVLSLTQTEQPTTKFAMSWWIDGAQEWARTASVSGLIRSLLPSIVATGSVPFSFDGSANIWLDPYRVRGKPVDQSGWKRILSGSGDLLPPTKLNVFMDHSIGHVRTQSAW